ncbi:response regulator transcription factor [uncultured Ilyobacter sp.]|uniref:response regulator transcription factor n=1 Tax=uncultured Ilyobacter sp. TaxID=544433 RepID=UPI0029C987D0|nr:response regulator transcription factor [uncultured Ilyobacter sp.]
MNKEILIIEDEKELASIIRKSLEDDGFSVKIVHDGDKAMEVFYDNKPDLVLLDINLPKKNGWEICKEIRAISNIPIIMMTARDSELDEIQGLELGADDYVTKPFSLKLISVKVKKLLKLEGDTFFKIKDLTFDFKSYLLTIDGKTIDLSRREAHALEYFLKHKGTILSREILLNEVWGFDFFGDERAVDTLIKRLRKKLGKYSDYIKSIRGVGYVFNEN